MTTAVSEPRPLDILAGVDTEVTDLATRHYVASDKIRFVAGFPVKIGGWLARTFDRDNTISGKVRSIFSTIVAGRLHTIIGTNLRLYHLSAATLTNVTPLSASSVAAADSLDTLYGTLANNPITTVNGSATLTIADAQAARLRVGDNITLSGASTTNGVPNTEINATHKIRAIAASSYEIIVATAATSSGSGGGASVVRATGLIRLNKNAHALPDGDRVEISAAATTGGVTNTVINVEHIIRNVSANYFEVMTEGTATSSVTGGGGAGTVYYPQIDAGAADEVSGQGYGAGLYGVGLYGTALLSTSARNFVRIWFMSRYASQIIATAGNQTGVYTWDADISEAPVLVANAPTAVNYAFVSDSILVTLGAGGVENKIFASDQDAITQWTASSLNSVYEKNLEDAGRLISHISVPGNNLIFSEQQCYTFRKVPRASGVWEVKIKDPYVGIIAPMARAAGPNGTAYWMSQTNFHMWRGGDIEIIPSNSRAESTIRRSFFANINLAQKSKCFAWHNEEFNEIWFHAPFDDEVDNIARLSLNDYSWCPDTMDRTAAEYPDILSQYPKMADSSSTLYDHERGTDNDTAALPWSLTTSLRVGGKKNANLVGFIPDFTHTGDVTLEVNAKRYPQSQVNTYSRQFTIAPETERVSTGISGRLWNYTFSGEELGQTWKMGQCYEDLQEGAGH